MEEREFAQTVYHCQGNVYIAGGWVRDRIRGVKAHDKDYVITGMDESTFCGAFPKASKVGKAFPVYLMEIGGVMSEVAFARKERKTGTGYKGFAVECDSTVTIEEDLYRRDTTMNSIAFCLRSESYIDPYHGIADIKERRIRATSHHFLEDPIRALRAARQAAQIGYRIEPETIELMRACENELSMEPGERMVGELAKALQTDRPSIFFRCLVAADLLAVTYPQIFSLLGKRQFALDNSMGDAFDSSMRLVDAVAKENKRVEVRFAALVHDLGNGLALSKQQQNDRCKCNGLQALTEFDRQMTLPKLWLSCAQIVIEQYRRAVKLEDIGEIVDLLIQIEKNPIGFNGFNIVMQAIHGELPDFLVQHERYIVAIHQVRGNMAPNALNGKQIGEWVRQQRIHVCQTMICRNKL